MKNFNEYTEAQQVQYMIWTLMNNYMETHPGGGCLHIVLEDSNYDCVISCYNDARKLEDYFASTLCALLMQLTEDEIEQVIERPHEIYELFTIDK